MKTKSFIFVFFLGALIYISVVAIEPSKGGKQFDETKEIITKVGLNKWKPWGGGWINYGEKGGAGGKKGEQGSSGSRSGGNPGGGGAQGGGEQNGGTKDEGSGLDGVIRGENNENTWGYLRDWRGDVGSEKGGHVGPQ